MILIPIYRWRIFSLEKLVNLPKLPESSIFDPALAILPPKLFPVRYHSWFPCPGWLWPSLCPSGLHCPHLWNGGRGQMARLLKVLLELSFHKISSKPKCNPSCACSLSRPIKPFSSFSLSRLPWKQDLPTRLDPLPWVPAPGKSQQRGGFWNRPVWAYPEDLGGTACPSDAGSLLRAWQGFQFRAVRPAKPRPCTMQARQGGGWAV